MTTMYFVFWAAVAAVLVATLPVVLTVGLFAVLDLLPESTAAAVRHRLSIPRD